MTCFVRGSWFRNVGKHDVGTGIYERAAEARVVAGCFGFAGCFGPAVLGSIKSQFWKVLSTFGEKLTENGSKTALTAPRPRLD
jgi:hypothetical protein